MSIFNFITPLFNSFKPVFDKRIFFKKNYRPKNTVKQKRFNFDSSVFNVVFIVKKGSRPKY